MIQRSLLSAVFIPHEVCTLFHTGECRGGYPLSGSGGAIPLAGGSGGKRGFGGEAPEAWQLLIKVGCH
jgi:hypothetical protein